MMRIMCLRGLKASWGKAIYSYNIVIGSHATATAEKENVVNDVFFYLLSKYGNCGLWTFNCFGCLLYTCNNTYIKIT